MASVPNNWSFIVKDYEPPDKPGTHIETFGFFNPQHGQYKNEDYPYLLGVSKWRPLIAILDIKANRDALKKHIAKKDKVTATANVVSNKSAEKTGNSDTMSDAMIAQIAAIVKATIAESEE